ncbi:2OG-Fe dioxygenase family protein [Micromonospora sp. WMMD1120]|uniref:2OG-Fe dioxygenase family protein n=1 Tax=Micromonospora sp. WMMD1120 TaxID=3016106 RepID=UPI00241712EB|nr:2OG-Fe dioxygenase family protein [Micromonospora sp. WMMD1120]MDG4807550.1 2OG-Fe dioxygenase family protein [Micromonospora sp. WMMD1120]
MTLNAQRFSIFDLPPIPQDVADSYGDLKFDEYMGDNRYRRFAQFRMFRADDRWEFERLPLRPYVTFSKYNPVAGGIRRYYQPIEVDFTPFIRAGAEEIPLDTDQQWQVNVHQFRIVVKKDVEGVVVPEGPHSDGRDYVLIGVFGRHGITGAEMTLMSPSVDGTPFHTSTLEAGQGVVFADREMFHYVSEIEPIAEEGHRDTLIATWVPWSDKWYGEEFEERAIAEG